MIRTAQLNDDGTVTCACGSRIAFLPPDLEHAPRGSVNHPGCAAAEAGASPAGADIDGKHETINRLEEGAVEKFYESHQWDAAAGKFVEGAPAKATPAAQAHADAHGIDLSQVKGTGKDGAVTKADVESFLDSQPEAAAAGVTT